jgi:uncharacterized protein (UPF0332 family)
LKKDSHCFSAKDFLRCAAINGTRLRKLHRGVAMLTWIEWRDKSQSSLAAAEILLAHGRPVEAASRAYYAAYQMVTAALLKLRLAPRTEYGNWSHHETVEMYRTHLCKKASLGFKEKRALTSLYLKFNTLLRLRYLADYGDASQIDVTVAQNSWRDASRISGLLNSLVQRGLL